MNFWGRDAWLTLNYSAINRLALDTRNVSIIEYFNGNDYTDYIYNSLILFNNLLNNISKISKHDIQYYNDLLLSFKLYINSDVFDDFVKYYPDIKKELDIFNKKFENFNKEFKKNLELTVCNSNDIEEDKKISKKVLDYCINNNISAISYINKLTKYTNERNRPIKLENRLYKDDKECSSCYSEHKKLNHLSCGHYACLKCLESNTAHCNKKDITCMYCRKPVLLDMISTRMLFNKHINEKLLYEKEFKFK